MKGIKNIEPAKADIIAGTDPDYSTRDLYNAIAENNFPSWILYIQTMTTEQAKNTKFNPFDITKVWPQGDYPLKQVGRIVLDRNPVNYFAEIEQLAFNPGNFIPGIGPSPDRLLQGRLFTYTDTHRYRLGNNYQQLPVNCPFNKVRNYQRDGMDAINNQGGAPNYHPNSFGGPQDNPQAEQSFYNNDYGAITDNKMDYYDLSDEDNFSQPGCFYRDVLNDEKKTNLINNLADSLKKVSETIRNRAIGNFEQVDGNLGTRLKKECQVRLTAQL